LRVTIIALHEQGYSYNRISHFVGKRQGAVSRFLRTFCGRPSLSDRHRRGAPRKLTTWDEHVIKLLILSGECQSAAEVARQAPNLGLPAVSANTVRRALRRQGLVARVKPPKHFLTKSHMRRRLELARAHRHWSESDWRRVLFSDETKLLLVNAHGRTWCWREPGPQPLCARAVMPSKQFGDGSILLWGCMSANGVGNLCRIFVTMTGSVYTEILGACCPRRRGSHRADAPTLSCSWTATRSTRAAARSGGWRRTTWPHSPGRPNRPT